MCPGTVAILSKWDINTALRTIPKLVNFSLPASLLISPTPFISLFFVVLKNPHRYKISFLVLIPSVVHQLINHPDIEKADFSSVTLIKCGAAYLPREMGQKLLSLAPDVASFLEGSIIRKFLDFLK